MKRFQSLSLTFILLLLAGCTSSPDQQQDPEAEAIASIEAYLSNSDAPFEQSQEGLWSHVIQQGDHVHPELSSIVTVAYRLQSLSGDIIDSASVSHPLRSRLARLIPGWQTALPMIGQGGIIELVVSPKLAYKGRSLHPSLGPWSPLYFHIQLLKVESWTP